MIWFGYRMVEIVNTRTVGIDGRWIRLGEGLQSHYRVDESIESIRMVDGVDSADKNGLYNINKVSKKSQ